MVKNVQKLQKIFKKKKGFAKCFLEEEAMLKKQQKFEKECCQHKT
jgi:hypothetical protein